MRGLRTAVVVVVLLSLAVPVLAHVPSFPSDNDAPERAVEVPDAVKSWSFYDRLDGTEAKYYRVTLAAGDRLRVGTFTPDAAERTPSLVIMSEGIDGTLDDPDTGDDSDGVDGSSAVNGSGAVAVPSAVDVPDGMGAIVVAGERPDTPTYEPFGPGANYHTADVDRAVNQSTTYLVAVYEPEGRNGPAGVSIGYAEEFTPDEYALVPFQVVRTHLWEGQHPLLVLGPFVGTVLAGAVGVARGWQRRWSRSPRRLATVAGGLLVLASGVNTLVQLLLALAATGPTAGALVTAVYVLVPLLGGIWATSVGVRDDGNASPTLRTRVGLVVIAVASLATWAGFVVGPGLLILGALLPRRVS